MCYSCKQYSLPLNTANMIVIHIIYSSKNKRLKTQSNFTGEPRGSQSRGLCLFSLVFWLRRACPLRAGHSWTLEWARLVARVETRWVERSLERRWAVALVCGPGKCCSQWGGEEGISPGGVGADNIWRAAPCLDRQIDSPHKQPYGGGRARTCRRPVGALQAKVQLAPRNC
jgi:hypothetical protein